ncbi:MAG: LL-diaminopimelate aminotransferase [Muribaculaceae bacterium]|nr:LL-diaminopimelate aminotransferase [Muribaculaceae bacterium]
MIPVNDNFRFLEKSYLFSEVGRRIREFKRINPEKEIIRMDIGDVTRPLFPCVIESMKEALEDMSEEATFKGYGPEQGYDFLREAITEEDYVKRGINISSDEIFVGDGAKSDLGNLGEIFSKDCRIGLMNPSYPAYYDDNVIDGRIRITESGKRLNLINLECLPENNFIPSLPREHVDIIYLCFPNNPTGAAITRDELKKWVDYALNQGSLIIYDSAYESFVREGDKARSIFEIEEADKVAMEVRSFSKTAGFTGVRCGYTVVPKNLTGKFANNETVSLNSLWLRRQTTKFNGVSYITQKGAFALYSKEGRRCIEENSDYYLRNARLIGATLSEQGFEVSGAVNSPYVWARPKDSDKDSWSLFQELLEKCNISVTPGIGFGKSGAGYIRLTGFNSYENTRRAMEILQSKNPGL